MTSITLLLGPLPSSRNLYKSNKSPSGFPWSQELNALLASERRTALQPLLGSGHCSGVTKDSRSGVSSVLTHGTSPAHVWPASCQRNHRPPTHPSVFLWQQEGRGLGGLCSASCGQWGLSKQLGSRFFLKGE